MIYLKDNNLFYSKIKRYLDSSEEFHFIYNNYDINSDKNVDDVEYENIKFKIYSVHALNIKDIKQRYSYIYDIVCDYLDCKFSINNICDFQSNRCISVRNSSHCKESLYGCCYGRNRGLCSNFKNGTCSIKSLSCKLFTCRYLNKKKLKFKINDIPLLKYFFNNKQKFILDTSIFKDKDEIIEMLLKSR